MHEVESTANSPYVCLGTTAEEGRMIRTGKRFARNQNTVIKMTSTGATGRKD